MLIVIALFMEVACHQVKLSEPALAEYQLEVCQLPETKKHEFPTEFRVSKAGKGWVKFKNVSPATGGYDQAETTRVEHQGKRFVAVSYGSDAYGGDSILFFDLKKRRSQTVRCPDFSCGKLQSFVEDGTCKAVVECTRCVEADGTEKPTTKTKNLCH
jgi:hypothetical protein